MADYNENAIGRNSNINLNNREANRNEERRETQQWGIVIKK